MEQQTVKTSKRFMAFIIDMLLIGILIQLIMIIFKTPIENAFHLESLMNRYYEIGQDMNIFDEARKQITQDADLIKAFNELTEIQEITKTYGMNQSIVMMICAFVSSSIFQFIVPLCIGQGRSIGKLVTKLRVVNKDGSNISVLTLFLRGFVGMTLIEYVVSIPLGFMPFMVSAMMVFVSNNKLALHDYIARTKVAYAEGFAPEVKVKEKEVRDPYHVTSKGFEYIDMDAIEKREKAAKERMENNQELTDEPLNNNEQVNLTKKVEDITMDDIEAREKNAKERIEDSNKNKQD